MFELKGVKYKNILDIHSLRIEGEQVTTIVGESGGGKTTLLKLLNHLISPDEGEIFFQQKPIMDWDPLELRRHVVMLSQQPIIFEGTVGDNLLSGVRFSQYDEEPSSEELTGLLERFRLDLSIHDSAEGLSGGEKQRVAMARLFLMNAPVFLIDEATSALDEATATLVMNELHRHIKSKKKTLIMVTHTKRIAEAYSDSVINLD